MDGVYTMLPNTIPISSCTQTGFKPSLYAPAPGHNGEVQRAKYQPDLHTALEHEMSLTWNKAAVTLSLWGGGKLPLACGFTSHASCVSKMAKRLSRPRHSTDSVLCTNINESDRQPTAMLRIYFFPHSLSPLIKDFLDILFCINMWSMPLLRGYPPEHYFWHICSRQYN